MTHGILSNGTVEIPGVKTYENDASLDFRIDGDTRERPYSKAAWIFTPDAPVEPDLPYGIYATKVWRTTPEVSVIWRHGALNGWKALERPGVGSYHEDHPRDHYAGRNIEGNWWDLIVRLTAEEQ